MIQKINIRIPRLHHAENQISIVITD